MVRAFIGLGSNLGDPAAQVMAGWQRLSAAPGVTAVVLSRPYRTSPVAMTSTQWFINAVGLIETTLTPEALHGLLLALEHERGRDRTRSQDRTLDLDLLFYDDLVMSTTKLTIPHPRLAQRLFVLVPLTEIAPPDFRHPISGRTPSELLAACHDPEQRLQPGHWPTPA